MKLKRRIKAVTDGNGKIEYWLQTKFIIWHTQEYPFHSIKDVREYLGRIKTVDKTIIPIEE